MIYFALKKLNYIFWKLNPNGQEQETLSLEASFWRVNSSTLHYNRFPFSKSVVFLIDNVTFWNSKNFAFGSEAKTHTETNPIYRKKIKAINTLDKRVCIFDQETRTQRGGGGAGSVWRIVAGTTGAWPAAWLVWFGRTAGSSTGGRGLVWFGG